MGAETTVPASDLLLTDAETYFDRVVKERRWTGRKTYGGGLEHTDSRYDWNRMALEEALDLAQYLAARCRQLEDRLREAREVWLDALPPERAAYIRDKQTDPYYFERLPPEWWAFEPSPEAAAKANAAEWGRDVPDDQLTALADSLAGKRPGTRVRIDGP